MHPVPWIWPLSLFLLVGIDRCAFAEQTEGKDDSKKVTPEAKRTIDPGRVWKVHITVPAKDYQAMQPKSSWGFFGGGGPKDSTKKTKDSDTKEVHRNNFGMDLAWVRGTVVVDGQTFDQVGIRYKGNGTLGDASRTIKKSFKIELDHFGGKGKFLGMKTINLHCGVADPSKCREAFGYGIYRAIGVPAPQTAWAEVTLTVPGKYEKEWLGLYILVEQVDKPFLRDHFGSDKGLLLKPEGVRDMEFLGDSWDRYKKTYAPKGEPTPAQSDRVISFARLIHKADDATFAREIESYLDIDQYLRFLLATAFVSNSDSFFVLGHNYYFYLNPKTNRFSYFPWDLDRAFANLPVLGSNNQQMNLSFDHPYTGKHRLTDRLLAMPGMRERYKDLLQKVSTTSLSRETLSRKLAEIEAPIRDLMTRDAQASAQRKDSPNGFGPQDIFGRPPALDKFVDKRTSSLMAQVSGSTIGYVPGGSFRITTNIAEQLMEGLDRDHDGNISLAEWEKALAAVFDGCQLDKQSRLDEKGLAQGLNKQMQRVQEKDSAKPQTEHGIGQYMAGPIFRKIQPGKEATVDRSLWMTNATRVFGEFDQNHDNQLTENELSNLLEGVFPLPKMAPPPPKPPAGGDAQDAKKK